MTKLPNKDLLLFLINIWVGMQMVMIPIIIAMTLLIARDIQLFYTVESMFALVSYCCLFGCATLFSSDRE